MSGSESFYYVDPETGRTVGPFSLSVLEKMKSSGLITDGTLVLGETQGEWKPYGYWSPQHTDQTEVPDESTDEGTPSVPQPEDAGVSDNQEILVSELKQIDGDQPSLGHKSEKTESRRYKWVGWTAGVLVLLLVLGIVIVKLPQVKKRLSASTLNPSPHTDSIQEGDYAREELEVHSNEYRYHMMYAPDSTHYNVSVDRMMGHNSDGSKIWVTLQRTRVEADDSTESLLSPGSCGGPLEVWSLVPRKDLIESLKQHPVNGKTVFRQVRRAWKLDDLTLMLKEIKLPNLVCSYESISSFMSGPEG